MARAWMFRALIAILVFGLGGCLAAVTLSANRGSAGNGVADPDDYLVELRTCESDGRNPRATGLIRNNSDRVQGFRVTVEAIDGSTASVIAARSHSATGLQPGEFEEFDLPIVDIRNVAASSVPEQIGCAVTVFYSPS